MNLSPKLQCELIDLYRLKVLQRLFQQGQIPAWVIRNCDISLDYDILIKKKITKTKAVKELSIRYSLSETTIYSIIPKKPH